MDTREKQDRLAELAAYLDRPKEVSIKGTKYTLAKLRPVDLAEARDHVVGRRIIHHMEVTGHMNIDPVTRAKTLAAIQCEQLSTYDVMNDPEGRLKLLHLSLIRADHKLTLQSMRINLDPATQDELFAWCMWISSCVPEPHLNGRDDDDSPLSTQSDTTTPPGSTAKMTG